MSDAPSDLPQSTYRLQFHRGFTFRDAAAIVPYLHELGITHCYASPYLKARPGSTHGYDVIDHCRLNPELGSEADFEAWLEVMRQHRMSHILDTVPNHVGVATNENDWWNDVLRHGPESRYAKHFDITWRGSPRPQLHDKVLLPLLGSPYGQVLEKGELKLTCDSGEFWVNYYERRFPVSPQSLRIEQGQNSDEVLACFNDDPDALHELLEKQAYRLAYWHVASDEINYRRFFDVNDLAALAMERQEVFDETHELTLRLCAEGKVAGLRIDHPDGLYDPHQYFDRLQRKYREMTRGDSSLYVLVEKILALDEPLPDEWPVHGTSGYDFLNMVNGLFVDAGHEQQFTGIYHDWLGQELSFDDLVYEKKKLILEISLASELHMLAHRLDSLAQRHRGWRDFTLNGLIHALRETIACFGVYRTYINTSQVSERDIQHVERAIEQAQRRNPKTDAGVFQFIREVLLQRYPESFGERDQADQLLFAGKFQQLTAPATAKGIEDTSFYIYNRLVSLNEVGGDPSRFGIATGHLHQYFEDRQRRWPAAMSTLSTHDTKRSEDVRARLNVLSEIPQHWREHVQRWREVNGPCRTHDAPTPNDEYLIYQTLVGAYPMEPLDESTRGAFIERIKAYVTKAMREAKVSTSWTDPNEQYERATKDFVARILTSPEFLEDFEPFQRHVNRFGLLNSLSQTVLKLTAPGVPDTYQGSELWDLSLVDPDNRRPVDYARRRDALTKLQRVTLDGVLATMEDGRVKLLLHRELLRLRRRRPELFLRGKYLPLNARGGREDHIFAFAREYQGEVAVMAVPRLLVSLYGFEETASPDRRVWQDTSLDLPATPLRHLFSDELIEQSTIRAAELFGACPFFVATNVG